MLVSVVLSEIAVTRAPLSISSLDWGIPGCKAAEGCFPARTKQPYSASQAVLVQACQSQNIP
jgi:hypothetical protein